MKWQEAMWAELDEMSDIDQITESGKWITHITQNILPALGQRRRQMVLTVLEQPDMDATRLAETIGSRRTTIVRLAEEGRARRREGDQAA